MTRDEAIDAALHKPEKLELDELFALHSALDNEVVEIRKVMGAVDEEIGRRERATQRPGDSRLRQLVGHGK